MAGLTDATRNSMLDHLGTLITHVSLHTADPGATGTSEVTGGSPAYARKPITWAAAAALLKTSSAGVTFDVPGATTVTHLGYWSALTAGTFRGSRPLSASETFTGQGTYTLAAGDIDETIS